MATPERAQRLAPLPGKSPVVAVEPKQDSGITSLDNIHPIDRDTDTTDADKTYGRLCRTRPLSVEKEPWWALFPHLVPRPSYG
ncbi:hypothetical protein [Streptomyces sp. NPDC059176]|uniref:hypothetical protein n=1 Tax=unclassified Streptomyces TaxID=2593676 RepID=UPI003694CB3F